MTSRGNVRWLEGELPHWVSDGLVSADAAGRVRDRYRPERARSSRPLFAALGATLIGLGIVLLLAHNWEDLPRAARTAISFGLLGGAQAIALFACARKRASTAWTEGGGLFLCLSVAAAQALVMQTYQVPGTLADFLWRWSWLMLPVVYALDSRGSASLYLAIAALWPWLSQLDGGRSTAGWALLAGIAPYLVWRVAGRAPGFRDHFLGWAAVGAVVSATLAGLDALPGAAWIVAVAGVLAALHVTGRELDLPGAVWIPALATAVGLFVLSFGDAWRFLDAPYGTWRGAASAPLAAVALLSFAVALRGGLIAALEGDAGGALFAAGPLAAFACTSIASGLDSEQGAALATSLYGLALGVATLLGGVREGGIARANAGMALLAGVIFARFVDDEWSFTVRGLAFIGLGAGFLLLNLRLRHPLAGERRMEA